MKLFLFASAFAFISRPVRFEDHFLIRVPQPLPSNFHYTASAIRADIWGFSKEDVTLFLNSQQLQSLKESFPSLVYFIQQENIQSQIDAETKRLESIDYDLELKSISVEKEYHANDIVDNNKKKGWFQEYHTYEAIVEWFKAQSNAFPELTEFIPSIGKTHEGRDIFAFKITRKNTQTPKKQIWVHGLQHAREWIGGATVQFITAFLLNHAEKSTEVSEMLNDVEFVFIPVMNPDGYVYTWTTNRLWRKNRRDNGFGMFGVDLNRNWNDHWGQGGSSSFPFAEDFMGPSAASEPEIQALSKFFLEQKNLVGAIDFHCYSQLILRPYGWTTKESPHEYKHRELSEAMKKIIKNVHGKAYVAEPSMSLYKTTGSASDWFYDGNVKEGGKRVLSLTIELRPSSGGANGFILDPKEIVPVGEEIVPAFLYFVNYAMQNPIGEEQTACGKEAKKALEEEL